MNRISFANKTIRIAFASGISVGVALVLALAPAPQPTDQPMTTNNDNTYAFRPNISQFTIPAKLDFAGEVVPVQNADVFKKLDREFLLNLQADGQILLYLKRSGEYFDMFDKILEEEGAPTDLKYLSVAESALYQAQSGKGAVGLWQFIPETARRYGLRVDEYVDERRNPEKSTRAAARYLKDNHDRFNSWSLAAAAYNQGEGATIDDINFQHGRTYHDLYLNEETSRYLYRIVAIKEIMSNPEKYGFHLDKKEYYPAPETKTVTVSGEIPNLALWAEANGSTYKEVKQANPWILKRTLPKPTGGAYQIKVPTS